MPPGREGGMKGGTAPPGKLCWFIWGEERRGEERRGEGGMVGWREGGGGRGGGGKEERRGEEEKKKKVEVRRDRKGRERSRKVS